MEKILEKDIHNKIFHSNEIKNNLFELLNCNISTSKISREEVFVNNITVDFMVQDAEDIVALVECKGVDINVTDYVRGIGQVYQYEYFHEQKYSPRNNGVLNYSGNQFKTILMLPSTFIQDTSINIADFKYPKTSTIFEINMESDIIREITREELKKLNKSLVNNTVSISPYYFRDNRVFEYYIGLRYVSAEKMKGIRRIDRKKAEKVLMKLETINNNNWRNVFITLSSLGLIDNKNLPTIAGIKLAALDFSEFAYLFFDAYLRPYFTVIINALLYNNNLQKNLVEIKETIKNKYHGKDVLFLTQSKTRYLSSYLNILRDDYGMINFKKRKSSRQFVYNILEIEKRTAVKNIEIYSKANEYIDNYEKVMR